MVNKEKAFLIEHRGTVISFEIRTTYNSGNMYAYKKDESGLTCVTSYSINLTPVDKVTFRRILEKDKSQFLGSYSISVYQYRNKQCSITRDTNNNICHIEVI